MNPADARDSDSRLLAQVMDAAATDDRPWLAEDLAGVFRHQLRAPLAPDLSPENLQDQAETQALANAATPSIRTFEDLLHHPRPPLPLLQRCRDFAKKHGVESDGLLPTEVARVLYFTSILLARVQGHKISSLGEEELRAGAEWIAHLTWIDARTRALALEPVSYYPPA